MSRLLLKPLALPPHFWQWASAALGDMVAKLLRHIAENVMCQAFQPSCGSEPLPDSDASDSDTSVSEDWGHWLSAGAQGPDTQSSRG